MPELVEAIWWKSQPLGQTLCAKFRERIGRRSFLFALGWRGFFGRHEILEFHVRLVRNTCEIAPACPSKKFKKKISAKWEDCNNK
jgi:hypothetical protein